MKNKLVTLAILIITDITVIYLSFILSYVIRSEILPHLFYRFKLIPLHPLSVFINYYYVVIVWVFIFAYEKLYTKRYPFWEEFKNLLKSDTLAFFLIMILIFITKKQLYFSRTIVVLAWLLSLLLFPLSRYFIKILLVRTHLWKKKLLIIGVHKTSLLILKNIRKNKTMGYEILGFLDDDPQKIGKNFMGVKVFGTISDLGTVTKAHQAKDIMIATPHLPRKDLIKLISECESLCDSMWLIPRTGDFISQGVETEILGDVLTLYVKRNLEKPWNIFLKTLFEKSIAIILTVVLSPLLIIITIAIKLDSIGPVFYLQKRLGQGKKFFNLYKFRSMYVRSEEKLSEYLKTSHQAKKDWEKYRKLKNYDPRVTRVGYILRKYSLDELPQLFNVLTGKMSLVGPRPYLFEELEGKESFIDILARVKPGITGLWQVSGRSEVSFQERIALDEYYIRNWSLWFDITILLKSVKVLFSSKGAY